jgi:hypothetical protein
LILAPQANSNNPGWRRTLVLNNLIEQMNEEQNINQLPKGWNVGRLLIYWIIFNPQNI